MTQSEVEKAGIGLVSPGFFCFLIVFCTGWLSAQQVPLVASLDVRGNTVFSANEVLAQFRTSVTQPFVPSVLEHDLTTLRERYVQRGYLLARTDPVILEYEHDSTAVRVSIVLKEGKQFVVDSVDWSGALVFSIPDLSAALNMPQGSPFSSASLERGIQEVLRLYEARGFPVASVTLTNVVFAEDQEEQRAKIFLSVSEGSQARIQEIRIEGNKSTREYVITRELRLEGDEIYTDLLARTLQRRLERLQLFTSVSRPEFYSTDEGSGGLLIRVGEGNVNRFDGVLGYVPTVAGEGGYVSGFVDIQLKNLFGTGRKLSTRWARENPTTQDLSLRYFEPWVASAPLNADLGFGQRKQDSTYVRRNYDISLALVLTEELTVGLSMDQTNVFPSERSNNPVGESRILHIGGSVRYDTRDDPVTPRSGVVYETSYEWGSKTATVGGEAKRDRTGRLAFDLEYYLSPFQRQVIAASLHGRDFQSSLVDQSDLFRLGGSLTLRGYRESQFLGSRAIWSSLEYRFLVGRRSFAYGFLDAGHISVPDRPVAGLLKTEATKLGYGVGVRIDSGLGLIGVNLAFGEGDTFRTAKLHFQLINEF